MAKVLKSSHPTKHYTNGGVVTPEPPKKLPAGSNKWFGAGLGKLGESAISGLVKMTESQTSKDAKSAMAAESAARRAAEKDAAESAEGARIMKKYGIKK